MWLTVLTILFIISSLYEEGKSLYMPPWHKQTMKKKLMRMMTDAIFDAKAKIQAMRYVRDAYRHLKAFEYAAQIYDLRRKYARLLQIHKVLVVRMNNNNRQLENKSIDFQPLMIEAIHLGIDIDHRVQAIEEYDYNPFKFKKEITFNNITTKKKPKKKKNLRYVSADERLHQMYSLIDRRWEKSRRMVDKETFRINERSGKQNYNHTTNANLKKNLDGLAFDSDLE